MSTLSRNFAVGAIALLALPAAALTSAPFKAGEETKPAAQIWADARAAMEHAKSFHVFGHDDNGGTGITVNLSLSPGRGGGSIQMPGVVMELVLAKGTVYIKADEKSWLKLTGSQATAELVANRWIEAPVTNADFSSFAELADSRKFIGSLAAQGTISKLPGTTTWEGRKTVVLVDSSGSRLYIADTGSPYMLDVQAQGSAGAGSLKFTDFGDAPLPAVPTNALSLPGT
ncbi:MAG: hypothetical protein ABSE77_05535 [Acidimicrobiales bacterium]|jgi:hypothetical protein